MKDLVLIAIICACVVGIWLLSPTLRPIVYRFLVGLPNLTFEELPRLLADPQTLGFNPDPPKKLEGAEKSYQLLGEGMSIIYHLSRHKKMLTETVDIAVFGKAGMILTLTNGNLVVFERIGGFTTAPPLLTDAENIALTKFLIALRNHFEKVA